MTIGRYRLSADYWCISNINMCSNRWTANLCLCMLDSIQFCLVCHLNLSQAAPEARSPHFFHQIFFTGVLASRYSSAALQCPVSTVASTWQCSPHFFSLYVQASQFCFSPDNSRDEAAPEIGSTSGVY